MKDKGSGKMKYQCSTCGFDTNSAIVYSEHFSSKTHRDAAFK